MRLGLAVLVCCLPIQAFAEDPHGCDKFAWPLDVERQLLLNPATQTAPVLDRRAGRAVDVPLTPLADAHFTKAPERTPKNPNAFAGSLSFGAADASAKFKITVSDPAWIDVVQDGHYVKPIAFSGVLDCPGARKSVKFDIGPAPFVLQLSDVAQKKIAVIVTPAN